MRITGWDQSQLPLIVEIVRCQTWFFPQNRGFITILVMHSSRFSSALTMPLYINPKSLNITVYCLPNILINWNSFLFGHLVKIQISHITKLSPDYATICSKSCTLNWRKLTHLGTRKLWERATLPGFDDLNKDRKEKGQMIWTCRQGRSFKDDKHDHMITWSYDNMIMR